MWSFNTAETGKEEILWVFVKAHNGGWHSRKLKYGLDFEVYFWAKSPQTEQYLQMLREQSES